MPVADDPPRSTLIEHFHSDHGRFGLVIDVFGPFEKLEERLAGEGVAADRNVGCVGALGRVAVRRVTQSEALATPEVEERALIPDWLQKRRVSQPS